MRPTLYQLSQESVTLYYGGLLLTSFVICVGCRESSGSDNKELLKTLVSHSADKCSYLLQQVSKPQLAIQSVVIAAERCTKDIAVVGRSRRLMSDRIPRQEAIIAMLYPQQSLTRLPRPCISMAIRR